MNKLLAICCLVMAFSLQASELKPAKNIQATSLSHGTIALKVNQLTKPTVILFADSLCPFRHLPDCEKKLSVFNKLVKNFYNSFEFLQIVKGYYVDEQHVRGYIDRFNIKVPTVWDTDNKIFSDYQVFGNPYVVIIDQQGKIYYRTEEFDANLQQALQSL